MLDGSAGTTRDILLAARDVSKSFGAVRVLHEVSFDVYRGEVLGILGPNGAGKTTLFNMISGDLTASGGEIRLGDITLKGEPPFRRCHMGIGRTYQIPLPYSGMTTFENLLVAAAFGGGRSEQEAYGFCAQILRDCELADKANTQAGSLTLLDRKRLELARALAAEPSLLLLDEWLAGLNPSELLEGIALIRELAQSGITILMVEHIMEAVRALCPRAVVMNSGRLIADAPTEAALSDPAVIAAYLGEPADA